MECPRNIEGSASELFYQDKDLLEYKAYLAISTLPYSQRVVLANFILEAVDRESAAEYFLHETSDQSPASTQEFIADWIALAMTYLNEEQKQLLVRRGDGSCFFQARNSVSKSDDLLPVYVIRSNLFADLDTNPKYHRMLESFLGREKFIELQIALEKETEVLTKSLGRTILISRQAFRAFENGQLSLLALEYSDVTTTHYLIDSDYIAQSTPDWVSDATISFVDRTGGLAAIPNPLFMEVNKRFSQTLSWIQLFESKKTDVAKPSRSGLGFLDSPVLRPVFFVLQHAWVRTPVAIRAYACQRLMQIGHRLYGHTGSAAVHRLPFGLYLRTKGGTSAARHQAEMEALRLVQRYTKIPAPRPVDTFEYKGDSYLIMTRVPGRPIAKVFRGMTDEQVEKARRDLSEYLAQLRSIPNRTSTGARICNSLGGGILDWRVGESHMRENLSFATVADFHEHLTVVYSKEIKEKAQRSYSKNYDIVFTHADLNIYNILADENGTITGIIDWECAGWYPEYWEYTKAHYTVRWTIRWLADVIDRLFPDYREALWVENMYTEYGPA